jgi:hypothetical protein
VTLGRVLHNSRNFPDALLVFHDAGAHPRERIPKNTTANVISQPTTVGEFLLEDIDQRPETLRKVTISTFAPFTFGLRSRPSACPKF